MTIFIVSLFLPYTLDFNSSSSSAPPSRFNSRKKSTTNGRYRKHSLAPSDPQQSFAWGLAGGEPANLDSPAAAWSIGLAKHGNGGLKNAINSAVDAGCLMDKSWIGTLGLPTDFLPAHTREAVSEKLETDYDALAVYVEDADFDAAYLRFCKDVLWPVFHYQIPDQPGSRAYADHSYAAYVRLNQAVADRIVAHWKKGDVIWIHDYHLLLVPAMVRAHLPDAYIGFFLHIAFPSSEVFRCLAVRRQLLDGVLGANLVGFQAAEYVHHFLQTCCLLLPNVEATASGVQLEDRFVDVRSFPIGIDPHSLDARRQRPDVGGFIDDLKDKYRGKRLVVARDKLDSIRGVRQKLLIFELFLNKYPQWRDSVVLLQVASSTNEQPELDATVSDIATRVNSVHSSLAHQPLVFLRQDLSFSQYLAMITVADVLMVTSLREGMNLTCHEFICCQDGKYDPDHRHGALILSEFTGSASLFGSHEFLVNPWNYHQCADDLHAALSLPEAERERDWMNLHAAVEKHTTTNWVSSFLRTLARVAEHQSRRDTVSIPRLSAPNLTTEYASSRRRLFILDYEGTLASWGSPTSIILTTPQRAIEALNNLLEDQRNVVYVMSKRMPEEMERLFRLVPGLGLIAENGCFVREARPSAAIKFTTPTIKMDDSGSDNNEEVSPRASRSESPAAPTPVSAAAWTALYPPQASSSWKAALLPMLRYFTERTPGSWIEDRHASLAWHFAPGGAGGATSTSVSAGGSFSGSSSGSVSGGVAEGLPGTGGFGGMSPDDMETAVRHAADVAGGINGVCGFFGEGGSGQRRGRNRRSRMERRGTNEHAIIDEGETVNENAHDESTGGDNGRKLSDASIATETSSTSTTSSSSFTAAFRPPAATDPSGFGVRAVIDVAEGAVITEPIKPNKASAAAWVFGRLCRETKGNESGTENGNETENGTEGAMGKGGGVPDFLFVAGDGREDECVFRWANQQKLRNAGDTSAAGSDGSDGSEGADVADDEDSGVGVENEDDGENEHEDGSKYRSGGPSIRGGNGGKKGPRESTTGAAGETHSGSGAGGRVKNVATVTLGTNKKNTEAMATLTQGVTGVLSLLGKLAKAGG